MSDAPPVPQEIRLDLSPALSAVILKALAKEPGDRFANGNLLATAVEQAIQQPEEADFIWPRTASVDPAPMPAPAAPPPAAVAMGQAQHTVTRTPRQEKVETNNGRSCLLVLLFVLIILTVVLAGGWFFIWEGRSVRDLTYLAQNGSFPPTVTASAHEVTVDAFAIDLAGRLTTYSPSTASPKA